MGLDTEQCSGLVSKNILINGRRTSVRLEPEMWNALRDIAAREKCTVHELCSLVNLCKRPQSTLTAGIRVFLMLYYKSATTDDGHKRAGHGDFARMRERAGRLRPANRDIPPPAKQALQVSM